MNTIHDSGDPQTRPPNEPQQDEGVNDLSVLAEGNDAESTYAQVARLQDELTSEKDGRREERFYFVAALVVLIDIIAFSQIHPVESALLLSFEMAAMTFFARNSGFEDFDRIFDRLTARLINNNTQGDKED